MHLIVFDVDGTLLNTTSVDDECYEQALLTAHGIKMKDFNWGNFKDVTDQGVTEDILAMEFKRVPTADEVLLVEEEMTRLVQLRADRYPKDFSPAPGIHKFIEHIRSEPELGFCLATGAWEGSARAKLHFLSDILDLEDIPWQHASHFRRRADIVFHAIEKSKNYYGMEKIDEITAFGDGRWDYLTAQEVGMKFIGVNLNHSDKLKSYPDVTVISNYQSFDVKTL